MFESRRLQKTLYAVVVASEDSEVGEYIMPVAVSYDEQGQPFTMLDRVTNALVDSDCGNAPPRHDMVATRSSSRWLPDLGNMDKPYRLVRALAEGDDIM